MQTHSVTDIVVALACGHLSNHGIFSSVSNISEDTITDDLSTSSISKLNYAINRAIKVLYSRYVIITDEVLLVQQAGRTDYYVSNDVATLDYDSIDYDTYIYITDEDISSEDTEYSYVTEEPTLRVVNSDGVILNTSNVIKIVGAYDEVGNELSINDPTAMKSIFTATKTKLIIPSPTDTNILSLVYQLGHHKININTTTDNYDTLKKLVYLPEEYLPALYSYCAYMIYSGGTSQEHTTAANRFLQTYELECQNLEKYGLDNAFSSEPDNNFHTKGWV